MKKFSQEQLAQINQLKPDLCYPNFGSKGELDWRIDSKGKINCSLGYEARDVDGDWGPARTHEFDVSFEKLLEIIKNPDPHFDTRSWN